MFMVVMSQTCHCCRLRVCVCVFLRVFVHVCMTGCHVHTGSFPYTGSCLLCAGVFKKEVKNRSSGSNWEATIKYKVKAEVDIPNTKHDLKVSSLCVCVCVRACVRVCACMLL